MSLVKVLVVLAALHLGMGIAQMTYNYMAGGVAEYGQLGILTHTPLGTIFPLQESERVGEGTGSGIEAALDLPARFGSMINKGATFHYGVLDLITPADGFVYIVITLIRITSTLIWAYAALRLVYVIFDSGCSTRWRGLCLRRPGGRQFWGASAMRPSGGTRQMKRCGSVRARTSGVGLALGALAFLLLPWAAQVQEVQAQFQACDYEPWTITQGPAVREGTDATFVFNTSLSQSYVIYYSVSQTGNFVSSGNLGSGKSFTSPGAQSTTISVPTVDDSAVEPSGTVRVSITRSACTRSATASVYDNDVTVTVSGGSTVTEGTAASFTLSVNNSPLSGTTIAYTVTQSGSYVSSTNLGSKTATMGTSATSATVTVATVGDSTDEANGSVTVTIAAQNAYLVGSPASASVTVNDDDATTVSVTGGSTVTEGTAVSFTATISSAQSGDTTVSYTVTQSGSYVASANTGAQTATLSSGSTTLSISIATVNDTIDEPNGSVTVTITSGTGYSVGNPSSASVTVNDDDAQPTATVTAGTTVTEGTAASFTVTFSNGRSASTTVNYTVTQSGGYVASANLGNKTATMAADATTVSVTVAIVDDSADESDGSVTFTVTSGTGYTVGSPASATVTVQDNDATISSDPQTLSGTFTAPSGKRCLGTAGGITVTAANNPITITTVCLGTSQAADNLSVYVGSGVAEADYDAFRAQVSSITITITNTTDAANTGAIALYTLPADLTATLTSPAGSGIVFSPGATPNYAVMASTSAGESGTVTITYGAPATSDPGVPESLQVSRDDDHDTAILSWSITTYVRQYQVNRLTAVVVRAGDASRIEYGDPWTDTVPGTVSGTTGYSDAVDPQSTYQYRIRAIGAGDTTWSDWSDFVFSGSAPQAEDLEPPGNVEITRSASQVDISWLAPSGTVNNYTVQRQELVPLVDGSTIFANPVVFADAGATWLSGDNTAYTDTSLVAERTYQYRVAGVANDRAGEFSEWVRATPIDLSLGNPPANFRTDTTRQNTYVTHKDFYLTWGAHPTADDYEMQIRTRRLTSLDDALESRIVTGTSYFLWIDTPTDIRIRARLVSAATCAGAQDNRCYSDWSAWERHAFTSRPGVVEVVEPRDPTGDPELVAMRAALHETIRAALDPSGVTVDPAVVLQFMVLAGAIVLALVSVRMGYRRGVAALGVGMACAMMVDVLYAGYSLFGIPVAWAIGVQVPILLLGAYALVRQLGVLR